MKQGDPNAAAELLPLVYDELRRLAAQKMAQEKPDQTLQATALVHEAYLRLVDVKDQQCWDNRRHFFAAAAEAMRRILVDNARRKASGKHGGKLTRRALDPDQIAHPERADELLALDEALDRLQSGRSGRGRAGATALFRRHDHPASRRGLGCCAANREQLLGLRQGLVVAELEK